MSAAIADAVGKRGRMIRHVCALILCAVISAAACGMIGEAVWPSGPFIGASIWLACVAGVVAPVAYIFTALARHDARLLRKDADGTGDKKRGAKVIDQDNAPLPGVKVKVSVKHTRELLPGATRDVFDYLDFVTDAEGMFSVTGRKGSLLGIEEMKKDGYEAPYTGNRAYWYAPPIATMLYTPDKTKPQVFRMGKKIGAERLVHKGRAQAFPTTARRLTSIC